MSDFALNVKWQEVLREAEAGTLSHCIAIAAPSIYHYEIIEELEMRILGCNDPRRLDSHPDLLVIGTRDKAPAIGETGKPSYELSTRWLIENIALKPTEAKLRLGVVMSADKLLLPAANSLLKLAEEPPEHAVLLFLMEDGSLFLPTLKSRSRFITLNVQDDEEESRDMPDGYEGIIDFLEDARKDPKNGMDFIINELKAWTNYQTDTEVFEYAVAYKYAEKIDNVRRIAEAKNLSVPMMCDIIILMLVIGDEEHEYILDDLR